MVGESVGEQGETFGEDTAARAVEKENNAEEVLVALAGWVCVWLLGEG